MQIGSTTARSLIVQMVSILNSDQSTSIVKHSQMKSSNVHVWKTLTSWQQKCCKCAILNHQLAMKKQRNGSKSNLKHAKLPITMLWRQKHVRGRPRNATHNGSMTVKCVNARKEFAKNFSQNLMLATRTLTHKSAWTKCKVFTSKCSRSTVILHPQLAMNKQMPSLKKIQLGADQLMELLMKTARIRLMKSTENGSKSAILEIVLTKFRMSTLK